MRAALILPARLTSAAPNIGLPDGKEFKEDRQEIPSGAVESKDKSNKGKTDFDDPLEGF